MAILSRSNDYESLPQSVNTDNNASENRNIDRFCVSSCFKIVIIYFIMVAIALIAHYSRQVFHSYPSIPSPNLDSKDPFVSSLINLNSHSSSTINTNNDITSELHPALYQSNMSSSIIIRLPLQWIESEQGQL